MSGYLPQYAGHTDWALLFLVAGGVLALIALAGLCWWIWTAGNSMDRWL